MAGTYGAAGRAARFTTTAGDGTGEGSIGEYPVSTNDDGEMISGYRTTARRTTTAGGGPYSPRLAGGPVTGSEDPRQAGGYIQHHPAPPASSEGAGASLI